MSSLTVAAAKKKMAKRITQAMSKSVLRHSSLRHIKQKNGSTKTVQVKGSAYIAHYKPKTKKY